MATDQRYELQHRLLRGRGLQLLARETKPALASIVVRDCRCKVVFREVWPQHRKKYELSIRGLQQEEIAHPRLARRAYHKIGFGQVRGVEITTERRPRAVVEFLLS